MFAAIAPILVPKNSYHGETPSSRPSLDDFLTIVPNNAAVPSSPSESVSSTSSYCSRSPPPEYMSENESMDQGTNRSTSVRDVKLNTRVPRIYQG